VTHLQKLLAHRARFVWDMDRGHADPRKEGFKCEALESLASGLAELEMEIARERDKQERTPLGRFLWASSPRSA
jgi:hypothetical protein